MLAELGVSAFELAAVFEQQRLGEWPRNRR